MFPSPTCAPFGPRHREVSGQVPGSSFPFPVLAIKVELAGFHPELDTEEREHQSHRTRWPACKARKTQPRTEVN